MNFFRLKSPLAVITILAASLFFAQAGAIHELIIAGDSKAAIKLMDKDAKLIEETDKSNCTPLHIAAEYSHTNVVKWLLKHKAKVNALAYDDFTPMHLVKEGGIAEILIKGGANLKLKDAWGKTPLQHAAQLSHKDVYTNILGSGFPLDLESALFMGDRESAKKIIRKKPDQVKFVDTDADLWGNTSPLGIAAGNGDDEMITLLLKAGAPVNAVTDRPGLSAMTPLCNAVWGGHYSSAELLCNAGADCNVTGGKTFVTIVDFAKKHSDQAMVDLLMAHGGKAQNIE